MPVDWCHTVFVCEQQLETRRAAAASQAKRGQWMNWYNDGATYDVLPTLQHLRVSGWVKMEAASYV